MHRAPAAVLALLLLSLPSAALAFPFGGQASTVVPCYNRAIFARLGPPRGGDYIWTPATKTYQFGAPSFAGQWLLGLASAPYYCVVSIEPVIVWPGTAIDMMGSSGGGSYSNLLSTAPGTTAAPPSGPPPTTSPPITSTPNPTTIGHVVISEVFYNVDSPHGSTANQWVELYNGSAAAVDVSGWNIQSASAQTALPATAALPSGAFLIVVSSSGTLSHWSIPSGTLTSTVASVIGGFSTSADHLVLKNAAGASVDAVSWGGDRSVFNPPVAASLSGYSLARKTLSQDTDTVSDWAASSIPTPGH
jgi:hypothetical protein